MPLFNSPVCRGIVVCISTGNETDIAMSDHLEQKVRAPRFRPATTRAHSSAVFRGGRARRGETGQGELRRLDRVLSQLLGQGVRPRGRRIGRFRGSRPALFRRSAPDARARSLSPLRSSHASRASPRSFRLSHLEKCGWNRTTTSCFTLDMCAREALSAFSVVHLRWAHPAFLPRAFVSRRVKRVTSTTGKSRR